MNLLPEKLIKSLAMTEGVWNKVQMTCFEFQVFIIKSQGFFFFLHMALNVNIAIQFIEYLQAQEFV